MPEGLSLTLNAGAGGLVALIVIMVLTERLITRKGLERWLALYKARTDEALERERYYKSANEKLQETVQLQQKQIDELIEQGRMSVALLESIDSVSRASGRHREHV